MYPKEKQRDSTYADLSFFATFKALNPTA